MKRIKYYILMLVIIFIMIGVCGCMKVDNMETKAEQTKKEALEYLNANYSDTFTARVYTSNNWAYGYESITFNSEKYPDEIVEVRVYKTEDGNRHFKDNYYHCYMLDDVIDYGRTLMNGEDVVVKVRFPYAVWSDELDGAQSFEAWKAQGTVEVDFFIITGNSLATDIQEGIVNKIATDKVSGTIVFFVTDDERLLQDIMIDEILNNQKEYVVSKSEYFINSNFEIRKD